MSKIAAVGDKDSIVGFQTLSIDTYAATETKEVERILFQLAQKGYAVIFITEDAAQSASEMIGRYKALPYPAIIPIPGNQGSRGLGMEMLKANVEKALGSDILFGKEDE